MLKRMLGAALAAVLVLASVPAARAVGTSASSAVLMDAGSGRVLYEANADEERLIASITKLMTALVALESGHSLDEVVTVRPEWAGAEGSSIYLQAGEKVTLETLLYGMLLRSGNDAALAVAGFCGGSVDAFVDRMNEKASALGMTHSRFANPNGLNHPDHYSSARDMALLARACLENETLARMVSTRSITLGTRVFTNHNKLLWRYRGCVGMKTGFTEKAGRTLVSAAERDGMTLICVTLNDPNDWADHTALLDYGFANYRAQTLTEAGERVCRLPVSESLIPFCTAVAGESRALCLEPGERVDRELRLDQTALTAPISEGTRLGEAVYFSGGTEVGRVPLVAGEEIPVLRHPGLGFLDRLLNRLESLSGRSGGAGQNPPAVEMK